ncbi:Alg9-like mannosyltransferase [Truncatella angustata]|uniref:Mannosyltransferase n=1 Tax=Truncatella angustata TaxID=152316 RepID=A0A9P8UZ20_9PEZI|nr:Alg9-like mannosyltransferase [Truncatella angustata]KAH6660524.1 Alg9-like mannosyltransferase [Truncatella angustata]
MGAIDTLLSLAIPALVITHLIVAPHTKVEESFNIQAAHDILVYGIPTKDVNAKLISQYDHFDFPGAVPRTFLGPVLLAGVSQPIVALVGFEHAQFIVRAVLGLFNAFALLVFKWKVERELGRPTARWFAILQASQFHVMFYASRTLPNMFAFGLTTLAYAQLVGEPKRLRVGRQKLAIALLVSATAIFRSELAILLCTTTAYLFLESGLPALHILESGLFSFVFSLLASIPIDTYFWQKACWPELFGFYFNVVLAESSAWGVSPWHYYFTNALPKIIGNPLALAALVPHSLYAPATKGPARTLILPTILYVAIYSIQPHKEARFIFYVVPPLTAAAAMGANYIFTRRAKSSLYYIASLALVVSVIGSFAISTGMLLLSSLNYPGGEALSELKWLVTSTASTPDVQTVMVHTDVLSCMTGVTLFGQHSYPPNSPKPNVDAVSFVFDKSEKPSILESPAFWGKFDYLLLEDPTKAIGPWHTVGVVEGFAGVEILRPGMTAEDDLETGRVRVLGRGAMVKKVRDTVRGLTGGWWVGPRMEPRVRILKKQRGLMRKEVKE